MNAHQLDVNGVITNTIVVDSIDVFPCLVDASIGGTVGDSIVNGAIVPKATPLPTQAEYTTALEAMYDAKAAERRYDSRLTCALRAGYAGPFQAEGTAFAIWMDDCNATAYGVMSQVMAGQIAQPTIPELLAMMPAMVWP